VRPPRLGGNTRVGVFATRSPFRPNPIGLSSVKLIEVAHTESEGDTLIVSGADILNGTPIYDIKPYLAYTDSHPEALSGFALTDDAPKSTVFFSEGIEGRLDPALKDDLIAILAQDPRPGYQDDPERIYTFRYADLEVSFKAQNGVFTVTDVD
jgi:hypothetical protein